MLLHQEEAKNDQTMAKEHRVRPLLPQEFGRLVVVWPTPLWQRKKGHWAKNRKDIEPRKEKTRERDIEPRKNRVTLCKERKKENEW